MTRRLSECEKAQRAYKRALKKEVAAYNAWVRASRIADRREAKLDAAIAAETAAREAYFAANPPTTIRAVLEGFLRPPPTVDS